MGVDAIIYVEGVAMPEQLSRANEMMLEICPEDWWTRPAHDGGPPVIPVAVDKWEEERISVNTLYRYYGPGYERGNWSHLYTMIRIMGAVFERPVFYGGDTSDYGEECTPEMLEELWQWQLGPHYNDYGNHIRAFNARNAKEPS
jgi:hypothetical protein